MMNEREPVRKPVRVFIDGCFDLFHFGHANAVRQAKLMGDVLVAGVHSDSEILKNKGPTVFSEQERYRMVKAMKWVDEVVEGVPYEYEDASILDRNNCDFLVHGDDAVVSGEGVDYYGKIKSARRYREFKRTPGISTTDLIGRILNLDTNFQSKEERFAVETTSEKADESISGVPDRSWRFATTTLQIAQFMTSNGPRSTDRVVYVDGSFDVIHVGHIEFLERASKEGTYLLVGVHDDAIVNRSKGSPYPISNLHERVLNVLSIKFVSNVVIGSPHSISREFMNLFNIHIVCHGDTHIPANSDGSSPYSEPIRLNKFKQIVCDCHVTTSSIIDRVLTNRSLYEQRNKKKEAGS